MLFSQTESWSRAIRVAATDVFTRRWLVPLHICEVRTVARPVQCTRCLNFSFLL